MNELPVVSYNSEWAVNPAYMTPASMSNFRPVYKDKLKRKARIVRRRS